MKDSTIRRFSELFSSLICSLSIPYLTVVYYTKGSLKFTASVFISIMFFFMFVFKMTVLRVYLITLGDLSKFTSFTNIIGALILLASYICWTYIGIKYIRNLFSLNHKVKLLPIYLSLMLLLDMTEKLLMRNVIPAPIPYSMIIQLAEQKLMYLVGLL